MNMHIADEHDHANCTWGYLTADRSSTLEVCGGGKVNKYGKNRQISAKISYIRGGSITQIWSILTIFIHKYPPLQDIRTSGFRVWIRHLPQWSWCAAQSWWNTARKTLKVEGETSTWGQKNRKKKTSSRTGFVYCHGTVQCTLYNGYMFPYNEPVPFMVVYLNNEHM